MIGGSGERKTLRLVALHADACNIFAGPEAAHKLEVLRAHCESEGRDYDAIEIVHSLSRTIGRSAGVRLRAGHSRHAQASLARSTTWSWCGGTIWMRSNAAWPNTAAKSRP